MNVRHCNGNCMHDLPLLNPRCTVHVMLVNCMSTGSLVGILENPCVVSCGSGLAPIETDAFSGLYDTLSSTICAPASIILTNIVFRRVRSVGECVARLCARAFDHVSALTGLVHLAQHYRTLCPCLVINCTRIHTRAN